VVAGGGEGVAGDVFTGANAWVLLNMDTLIQYIFDVAEHVMISVFCTGKMNVACVCT
jgi:hypothetical protein